MNGAYARGGMSTPRAPLFGAYLAKRRGSRTPRAIAAQLAGRGYRLNHSAIWKYEQGAVPKIEQLAALAVGYGISFADLAQRLAAELLGHPVPEPAALSERATALAHAFDQWDPERQAAFLTLARVVDPGQSGAAPIAPPATRRGRAIRG